MKAHVSLQNHRWSRGRGLDHPPPRVTHEQDHFERDRELGAWLEPRGLSHLGLLCAEVLAPELEEAQARSLRWVLSVSRLAELATTESVRHSASHLSYVPHLRQLLPAAAYRFLRAEEARARAGELALAALLAPPAEAALATLSKTLVALHARHARAGSALAPTALGKLPLRLSDDGAGFTVRDERRSFLPGPSEPRAHEVTVHLGDGGRTSCSCEQDSCHHARAAVERALLHLHEPRHAASVRALAEGLTLPAWERALRELDALEQPAPAKKAPPLAWRVSAFGGQVSVQPWLRKSRVGPDRVLQLPPGEARPSDLEAARLLLLSSKRDAPPRGELFRALLGHPAVYPLEGPEEPLQVLQAQLGLHAEERGGAVVVSPAVAGAPLPLSEVLRRTEALAPQEPFPLYEPQARRLLVVEVPHEARATLQVLRRHGADFPPEARDALLSSLSRLSARLPVALPRSMMGEALPPSPAPVLRLQLQPDGGCVLELRVRALEDAPSFSPGEGPPTVHVRRGGRALHARRDMPQERALARAFVERLPLGHAHATEQPFTWTLATPEAALGFLADAQAMEGPPPVEWTGPALQLSGRAAPTQLRVALERKKDWFGVSGGLSVGGDRVELAVLLDAVRRKARFVKVEERSYVELSEALRAKLLRLSDHAWRSKQGVEVGLGSAEALDALAEAGADVSADQAWRELSARIFAARSLEVRVPRGLSAELRPYQREGFGWLLRLASWGAGGVLADDMGLGKTVQALAVLLERAKGGPQLVVAPTSVGFNWVDEARRFSPSLRLHVYADAPDREGLLGRLGAKDVLVCSYGLLARDGEALGSVRFRTAVFDEAQALKNAGTARAKAARGLQADFRFALSGTPLENHLGELWSLYRVVLPGLLGSWDAFRDRYALPIEKKLDPDAAPALARVLEPFLLRRAKADVASELPPRTEVRVPVVPTPAEWQLYEDARLSAVAELESGKGAARGEAQRRVQVLAALTRLRLAACHAKLYDASADALSSKLERLCALVEELRAEGHRALVFSQFTSHLELAEAALRGRGVSLLRLDGSTPRAERAARVKRFQAGEGEVFLISLKAGGSGLNLTGADYVVHLDPWWNPAVEDQASDRAHRLGQSRPVTVYRLVARGTIEERVLEMHGEKRALVGAVLSGKDRAGKLDTAELLSLLTAPAQGETPGGAVTRH
jgi:superfamily II DNA or RNA helicase